MEVFNKDEGKTIVRGEKGKIYAKEWEVGVV
jgi:hypothetical protein